MARNVVIVNLRYKNRVLVKVFQTTSSGHNYRMSTLVWARPEMETLTAKSKRRCLSNLLSVIMYFFNFSLTFRVCNVWQFKQYLFLSNFLFIAFVAFLVCCQLTRWIKLKKHQQTTNILETYSQTWHLTNWQDIQDNANDSDVWISITMPNYL